MLPIEDLTTAFLSVLYNETAVTKLATVLSASINLPLTETITPVLKKFD